MFGLFDLLRLVMAALVILPITAIIRESGYYIAATLLGAKEKKLIVGSGPTLFTLPTIEVRRYFFMYSWMEYEELHPSNRFWHGIIYVSPIFGPLLLGILINTLLAQEVLPNNMFWDTFMYYIFYYIFFDLIPVYLPDGQPTNGRAIFDLIWRGERSDFVKKAYEEESRESEEEQGYTETQEETINRRDRDEQERSDHTRYESDSETQGQSHEKEERKGFTDAQEETIKRRDRDEQERSDHTNPESDNKD
ncbi:hypothetical protein [Virgibacillus natechei]|uniref:hypothetical protein n=1 Tax=Virgibacillus natechei TaxID=1216297 RepID=UPI001AE53FB8|nr:hypothetical protein [Virgibacillus natechei]UZD12645.1 hypothetical protein OLD84_17375 [Virgibacillus natechei]